MENRMDKVGKILFLYGVSTHTKKPLDIEKCASEICQLFPQPLDDKELREKLQHLWCQHCKALQKSNEVLVVECWYNPLDADKAYVFCAANCDAIDHLFALLQPKIEEARRQERERIQEWLEYNAPEYVWQKFKDGKDVR